MTTTTATTPGIYDKADRLLETMFGVAEDGACYLCGKAIPGDPDRCLCDACCLETCSEHVTRRMKQDSRPMEMVLAATIGTLLLFAAATVWLP